jgi:hypothetical protein
MHRSLRESLYVTEPRPVAVKDPDATLQTLYRAYLQPRGGGGGGRSKNYVLDQVVNLLRSQHRVPVRQAVYIQDFLFDAVLDFDEQPAVLGVISFGVERKDWAPVEREAGYFAFGVRELELAAQAVIQPPATRNGASEAHSRVRRLLDRAGIDVVSPKELQDPDTLAPLRGSLSSSTGN